MKRLITRLFSCVILLACCTAYVPSQSLAAAQSSSRSNATVPDAAEAAPAVPAVVLPVKAPNPPHITCQGGQLTILADNATMGSVLAGIHDCTGVTIQIPAGVGDERTFLRLGPGPARDVLDDLFSSTELDYVIESSDQSPGQIRSILLTARIKDIETGNNGVVPPSGLAMTPARRAWMASRNNARSGSITSEDQGSFSLNDGPASTTPVQDAAAPPPPLAPTDPSNISAGSVLSQSNVASPAPPDPTDSPQTTPDGAGAQPVPAATLPISDAPASPNPSPAPDSVTPAPSSSTGPGDDPSKVLQNKINQMQQMFEERKKLNTVPPATSNPN